MKSDGFCCQAGQKSDMTQDAIFERELALCKQLCHDNKGRCHWGVCTSCGVIPLLYKLYKGVVVEDPHALREMKKRNLGVDS